MAEIAELLTRLNVELRDTENKVFSAAEKTEALTRAIEDESVYSTVEDTSQVVVYHQREYDYGTAVKSILSVGVDLNDDGYPIPVPGEAWEFIDGKLIFDRSYMNLTADKTIHAQVSYKWTIEDDIPDPLVPYVLNLGIMQCNEYLANIKVNRFLKNDTSMGEIVARINLAERSASRQRKALHNQKLITI